MSILVKVQNTELDRLPRKKIDRSTVQDDVDGNIEAVTYARVPLRIRPSRLTVLASTYTENFGFSKIIWLMSEKNDKRLYSVMGASPGWLHWHRIS